MRTSELVVCSQTSRRPFASRVMPLPLLLGLAITSMPFCSSHRRRVSPGMSEKSRNCPSGFQIGPSVKVKPVASCSTSAFSSMRLPSLSDLTSTLTLSSLSRSKDVNEPNRLRTEKWNRSQTPQRRNGGGLAPMLLLAVPRLEVERERVDAVALAGRVRPVGEHVAEVRVAGRAAHLDPAHPVGLVDLDLDRVLLGRLEEARPPGAGVELGLRAEELGAARPALEDAVLLHVVQVARPGRLGGRAPEDRVAVGVELLPPLLVCLADLFHTF